MPTLATASHQAGHLSSPIPMSIRANSILATHANGAQAIGRRPRAPKANAQPMPQGYPASGSKEDERLIMCES